MIRTRPVIRARLGATLAICAALLSPLPASADILTRLLRVGEEAGHAGAGAARSAEQLGAAALHAAKQASAAGASVLISDGLVLRLVIRTENQTVTTAVQSAEDVTAALTQAGLSALYVAEEHLPQLRSLLTSMTDAKDVRLLRRDATAVPLELSQPGRLLAQVDEGRLFVELRSTADIDRFRELARLRVPRSQIDVYSLFDPREIDIVRQLDRGAGDVHHAVKPAETARLPTNLAAGASDRVAVVVGHIEGPSLVMRGTGGEKLASVAIAELEASMARAGRNVLVLGCESAGVAASGFLSPVNVGDLAEALSVLRHGGTHGELLSALAKASPEGLVVTDSLLGDFRLAIAARARADQVAEARQTTFNRFRVAAVIPGSWFNPVQAVLQTLVVIWFIGLLNSVFQLGTAWQSWKPARAGDSYASPLTRRLRHTRDVVVFMVVFPYLVAAEIAYLIALFFLAATPVAGAVFAPTDRRTWLAVAIGLAVVAGYALVLFAWQGLLRARPPGVANSGREPYIRLLPSWRDYLALLAFTIGLPLALAALAILPVAGASTPVGWVMTAAVPLSAVAFTLLLRACRDNDIGPYDLAIVAAIVLYRWLRRSRRQQALKPMWHAMAEAWREQ